MSLAKLLASIERDGDERPERKSPPDVLCVTLREVFERYAAPCPFKPGDLVTTIKGANLRGAGEPHMVLDVLDRPTPNFAAAEGAMDTSSCNFGQKRDMRLLCESEGRLTAFWVESWQFEPYALPTEQNAA